MQTYFTDIQQRLMANIDPEYYENLKKLVPTDQQIIGVKVPKIRESVKEFNKEAVLTYNEALSLLDTFFENDIREERRLFYVAMTRAMERLFLTRAKKRRIHGRQFERDLSQFVADIENNLKIDESPRLKNGKIDKQRPLQLKLF